MQPWGHCDKRCNGGVQTQVVVCSNDQTGDSSDEECFDSSTAGNKPDIERVCNVAACPGTNLFSKKIFPTRQLTSMFLLSIFSCL